MKAAAEKLARYRVAVIDDELAGRPFRLSVLGKHLRIRPWVSWASSIYKSADQVDFEVKGGKALDKIARPMDGFGFTLRNSTDKAVTLAGFPTVPAGASVGIELVDGKWSVKREGPTNERQREDSGGF